MRAATRRPAFGTALSAVLLVSGLLAAPGALAAAGQPGRPGAAARPGLISRPGSAAQHRAAGRGGRCRPGARTLSGYGAQLYPDTGNGGYISVHTSVDLVYDAVTNRFLPGNHVLLTDRAAQCLTAFSLDFERRSLANISAGPDMRVRRVLVDGRRAAFRFVQPTYPGDPRGPDDPNPLAHEASQHDPVGGPQHNPLPPACTPELKSTSAARRNAQNGQQCPANKLVITPTAPIRDGTLFRIAVYYTGRPGVHTDGDGTTEGWFRSDQPPGDGGFVTTEPVGTEDWMPLNDYPSAKPAYDFHDTVTAGRTVLANGILEWARRHRPDRQFPHGSVTWHWHSPEPVASYLVEDSVGHFDLTRHIADGIPFYEAQASSLSPARKRANLAIMNKQPEITRFESQFSGPFPFSSDGVVVGRPPASFEEEMQTMITFSGGQIDTDTLYHENMHQWWGDHVTESGYRMTFYKEGLATLAEYLYAARRAQAAAGGPGSRAGRRAFRRSLIRQFDRTYPSAGGFWTTAPSNPTPFLLFGEDNTYARPGAAYIALRQILGPVNFTRALTAIQRAYGGRSITERQLEAGLSQWLPERRPACRARLDEFFRQWFDTAYRTGGGRNRPRLTGPGLVGRGFYGGACPAR
ncbi:MAG: M1 family aminopeptidase [Streptosporangiaceae bacterium]